MGVSCGLHFLSLVLLGIIAAVALKRCYVTPLRDIPGSWLASVASLWQEIIKLPRSHGNFVRVADNGISVAHLDAVRQLLHANITKGSWYSIFSLPGYHYMNQMSKRDPHLQIQASLGEVTFSSQFQFFPTGSNIRNAIANTRALALYIAIMGHYVWLHNLSHGNPLLSRIGLQPPSHIFDTCLAAIQQRKCSSAGVRLDMMGGSLRVRHQLPDRLSESAAFFYYLIRHPRYKLMLLREIEEAQIGGDLSEVVLYAEAAKLPYLQARVGDLTNSNSCHAAIETGLHRVIPAGGLTVDDQYIPAGIRSKSTVPRIDPWGFHRNPGLFGSDCNDINPYHYEIRQADPRSSWRFGTHFTSVPYG
ncbi:uncharacterized protein BDW43DRAFT_296351 [Aspergillus alliaceus]|uniref:uncharacterized protein n=1 Tax=Petromyces alliaceus TaxID=209559 RepID=UPI0012A760C9|nr:uncharacterized protein BDW43DRAFT_296351 [Aspergillus alliaceus]KAB8238976.1 hypothetical protein BDW43DRAFT_296351 [Aspergillus alliaceus]